MANTLYDYYTGKGQKLPSVQERSKLYESYGLGQAGTYGGTAEQNTALLGKLGGTSTASVYQPNTTEQAVQRSYPGGVVPNANSSTPPKVVEPASYVSQTSTGQNTLKALQDAGFQTDYQSLMKTYRDYGLEGSYGSFTGSNEQYNAIRQAAVEDTRNKLSQYQSAAEQAKTAGYTPGTGQDIQTNAQGQITPYSAANAPTQEFVNPTPNDFDTMTQGILDSIGTTDLTKLIQEFSSGTLTTPEMELTKEDKEAQLTDLKASATQGLQTIQKSLAQRGMTFSGIRTEAEANFAADVLSKESGINREFAGKIIAAARQEQGRREAALTAAEDNYNNALEAQGYVFNPITNTVEKTLQREDYESGLNEVAKPITQQVGGNMYTYDPTTQQWNMTIRGEESSTVPTYKSGGLEVAGSDIANAQQDLDAHRGSDGYTDTGKYLSYLKNWTDQLGLAEDFFNKFPPQNYLRYGDPTIPQYIKDKLKKPGALSMEERIANAEAKLDEQNANLDKNWWEFWKK